MTNKPAGSADSPAIQIEEDLLETKQLLEQIISGVQEGVIVYDLDLRYQVWNPFMEHFTGMTAGEVLGKHPSELFPFLQASGVIERLERILSEEAASAPIDFPYSVPKTGRSGWASDLSTALRNAKGEIIGIIATVHDITKRKQAEQNILHQQKQLEELNYALEAKVEERTEELLQERNNFKSILDTMNNGVYIVNQHLMIEYANPALLREFGPIEDRSCHEYLHGSQDICPWCNNLVVFSGQSNYREWTSEITGKTYSTVDTPYKNNKGEICKLAILHDVTEQKIADNIIRNHNKELEEQITERTKALVDANEELIVINRELELKRRESERTQEIAHLGSWELDIPTGLLIWSDEVYRIFGLLPQEFPATYEAFLDAVHPEDRDAVNSAYMGSIHEGKDRYEIEHRVIRAQTGEIRFVHEKCEHIRDASGNIVRSVGMVHDITDHKLTAATLRDFASLLEQKNRALEVANEELIVSNNELELRRHEAEMNQRKLQQLSGAVENSPVAIVITDYFGRIEYVNPKFTKITGYLPEEAIGQNPRILNAGIQPKKLYQELWETILAGHEWSGDFCNRKKNGGIFWEHASISPIRDTHGNITHFVGIKEDVTEQKRIFEKLLTAQDAARAASISKSEFLANMSHEIRTPLSAIIGFSDLALKTSLPPRQHGYIEKIQKAGELLLAIINDILDFSKIEARQLDMNQTPFRLDTMLANVNTIVQYKALNKGLNLLVEMSPEVEFCLIGDPHRLSQIIVNLLSNAIKFTEHGEVALDITRLNELHDRVQLKFSVRDTGIGISAEHISKLFQPFTQADGSMTRRFGGTGLGLSISKQLVALMGGEIWCESQLGQGSTFCFTAWFGICQESDLERCASICTTSTGDAELSFDFSGSHILLVEDNEINQQLAIEILNTTGAVVDLAANGKEAVSIITGGNTQYDLVLMDIKMPLMNGYEATRLIRSDSRFTSLPIIAMTAHAMLGEQQNILQSGMDAHITKPIDARTMLRVIRFFLREQELSIHLRERFADTDDDELELPDIVGLNKSNALIRLDGNRKLYLWVLRSFVKHESNAAVAIEEALRAGDTMLALHHTHKIITTAGTIGSVELVDLARSLENAIEQGEPDTSVMAALERFTVGLDRIVTELTRHLSADSQVDDDTSPGVIDVAVVTPIMAKLLGYIEGRDGKAERFLDDYQKDLAGFRDKELGKIKSHLKHFDFTAAHDALLSLLDRYGIILTSNGTGDSNI